MNKTNLQTIFKKYIDNFEMLNNRDNNEIYKWEIAQEFQSFDVDADDFVGMLDHMWKVSNNLIDSSQQLPFYALVDYARREEETETVREMFRKLFKEEHLDNKAKQAVIDEFIESGEQLRKKHYCLIVDFTRIYRIIDGIKIILIQICFLIIGQYVKRRCE